MLSLEDISLFVGGKLLVKDASFNVNRGDRIGVVGRNGTGKSHLMELLAGQIAPDGGTRRLQKGTTVLLVKQELPDDDKTPLDFLRDNDPDIQELEAAGEASDGKDVGGIGVLKALFPNFRKYQDQKTAKTNSQSTTPTCVLSSSNPAA